MFREQTTPGLVDEINELIQDKLKFRTTFTSQIQFQNYDDTKIHLLTDPDEVLSRNEPFIFVESPKDIE